MWKYGAQSMTRKQWILFAVIMAIVIAGFVIVETLRK